MADIKELYKDDMAENPLFDEIVTPTAWEKVQGGGVIIKSYDIKDGAIGTDKMADDSVTSDILAPDAVLSSKLTVGNKTWTHDLVFSSSNLNTVAWTAGTITMADGSTYSIDAGNTGAMANGTYIFLDVDVSETVLQITTTPASAVGDNRVMLAWAKNSTTEAIFQVFSGSQASKILGTDIEDKSLTADQIAALAITSAEIALKAVTYAQIADDTITASQIAANTITKAEIAALTITSAEIALKAVTYAQIADATLTSAQLALKTITASVIGDNVITAGQIHAGTITTTEIAANTIVAGNIASNTITAGNIAALTITAAEIAAATITGAKIAATTIEAGNIKALTITASEIAAGTITGAKIAALTIEAGNIKALTITAAEIAAATITGAKIAAGTVEAGNIKALTITASEIAAGTITGAKIAALTIEAGNIKANTITAGEIAAGTITTTQIAANTIEAGDIKAGTITATEIATGTITATQIKAATITATELAADSVTATQINVSTLSAISADMGTITAGTITSALVRTDAGTHPHAYMDSSGFFVNGQYMTFNDTLGNLKGEIFYYPTESAFFISGATNVDTFINGDTLILNGANDYVQLRIGNSTKCQVSSVGISVTGSVNLTENIIFDGSYIFTHNGTNFTFNDDVVPSSDKGKSLGTTSVRWSYVRAANISIYGSGSTAMILAGDGTSMTVDKNFVPSAANAYMCGTSTNYWTRVYSDAYFTKNTSFQTGWDKYDDLQIIRDLRTTKDDSISTGYKLDISSLPEEMKDGKFVDYGGLQSFNLCAMKKMVECIDDLKNRIEDLESQLDKKKEKVDNINNKLK